MTAPATRHSLWGRIGYPETIGLVIVGLLTVLAVVGPWLAPHPIRIPVAEPFSSPSLAHLFGTDEIGRDVLSRVLHGVRLTWFPALAIIGIGVFIGGFVGFVSGVAGGRVDRLLQRFTDLFLVLPSTIIAIAVIAALGPGVRNTIIAISVFWWPWYSRIVRSEVAALVTRPHVEAARLAGVSRWRLSTRYILPGAAPAVLVAATLDVANVILVLSLLSFLGLGAPAPAPELGAMTAQSLSSLVTAWWIPVWPAVIIAVMSLAANTSGDGVRNLMESM